MDCWNRADPFANLPNETYDLLGGRLMTFGVRADRWIHAH